MQIKLLKQNVGSKNFPLVIWKAYIYRKKKEARTNMKLVDPKIHTTACMLAPCPVRLTQTRAHYTLNLYLVIAQVQLSWLHCPCKIILLYINHHSTKWKKLHASHAWIHVDLVHVTSRSISRSISIIPVSSSVAAEIAEPAAAERSDAVRGDQMKNASPGERSRSVRQVLNPLPSWLDLN